MLWSGCVATGCQLAVEVHDATRDPARRLLFITRYNYYLFVCMEIELEPSVKFELRFEGDRYVRAQPAPPGHEAGLDAGGTPVTERPLGMPHLPAVNRCRATPFPPTPFPLATCSSRRLTTRFTAHSYRTVLVADWRVLSRARKAPTNAIKGRRKKDGGARSICADPGWNLLHVRVPPLPLGLPTAFVTTMVASPSTALAAAAVAVPQYSPTVTDDNTNFAGTLVSRLR